MQKYIMTCVKLTSQLFKEGDLLWKQSLLLVGWMFRYRVQDEKTIGCCEDNAQLLTQFKILVTSSDNCDGNNSK